MKIAIDIGKRCWASHNQSGDLEFALSDAAIERMVMLEMSITRFEGVGFPFGPDFEKINTYFTAVSFWRMNEERTEQNKRWYYRINPRYLYTVVFRTHPILIQVIEEMGSAASAPGDSCIVIVDIPDDIEWEIVDLIGEASDQGRGELLIKKGGILA